jgi:signal transduction histidine kinase/ActR/RegA family two-component response regulator
VAEPSAPPEAPSSPALPSGTVTFLFTDLEGSNRLIEAHPDSYRDLVRRHHALLRGAVEAHGGAVFETVGDSAYAAFARPAGAVAAAVAGQLALQREVWGALGAPDPPRVRMGLHTGEVERQGSHYFGAPLYRCARLTATVHGGQVVLSAATADLVRDALPPGATLRDLGELQLQALSQPMRAYQVLHPDLPAEFPPPRVAAALRSDVEALLTAKQAAEEASQAKSEFLSRMSHELRTPLNAILGFAQLLELDDLTADQRESVDHILRAGRHLLDLVNEVLDLSRIEAGRLQLSPEPVLVGDVLREALDLVRPLAAERRVRLAVGADAGAAAPRRVVADLQRLKQVLLNLLSNAIKYNREGGGVVLACEAAPDERLRLVVTDTGPGIPADRLARLFTPFERLGAEQSGVEGTGLGLALSQRLVAAMGGTLGVESRPGQGSSFWVELPPAGEDEEEAPPADGGAPGAAPDAPAGPGRTVLYVEDNLSNLALVRRVLARRPRIALLTAMQGQLGLDLARSHRPALVLLDLHLPDVAGEDVLRALRAAPETRDVPVVVVSADATPRQVERLLAAGARSYLTKPLDVPRLLQVVDETLAGAPGQPPDAGRRAAGDD